MSNDKPTLNTFIGALIVILISCFAMRCNGQKHCASACDGSYTVSWIGDCRCEP